MTRKILWCCLGGCGRRGRRTAKVKIHGRRFFCTGLGFEKWPGPKTKYSREKVCREGADGDIVVLHGGIEVSAFN